MNFLIGVCGSIAAYRSPDLVKELKKRGHNVRVALTQSAEQFVTRKTLETFSGGPVATSNPFSEELSGTDHISWARWAERVIVYGATADFIARLAQGRGDDFLSLQLLAFRGAPIVLAPAMNTAMWENPLVQNNVRTLSEAGYCFAGPVAGDLACGETGLGHIAPTDSIIDAALPRGKAFFGKKVLISGGPMRSYMDPVRYLQNSSSGEMALSLAEAMLGQGADVTLLLGAVDSQQLVRAQRICPKVLSFESYQDYRNLLDREFPSSEIFISAAAVLDFELQTARTKQSRADLRNNNELVLKVRATEDLAALCQQRAKPQQKVIAFALESGSLEDALIRARDKLSRKGSAAIVMNLASNILNAAAGRYHQWVLLPNGQVRAIEAESKPKLAEKLIQEFASL